MKKLRIYFNEKDKLCNDILELLKDENISGVSIFKTIYSYGHSKRISNIQIEVESYNMGMRADVIDEDDKIYSLVKSLKNKGFLMVVSDVSLIL